MNLALFSLHFVASFICWWKTRLIDPAGDYSKQTNGQTNILKIGNLLLRLYVVYNLLYAFNKKLFIGITNRHYNLIYFLGFKSKLACFSWNMFHVGKVVFDSSYNWFYVLRRNGWKHCESHNSFSSIYLMSVTVHLWKPNRRLYAESSG